VLQLHTPAGQTEATLAMAGQHNVHNALAAVAACIAAGVPLRAIVAGLQGFRPVAGRSQLGLWSRGGRAVTLVNDSYNANPDSVRAAIAMLAGLPGPHWLVLGDMGEVGGQGPAFHAEVGALALARNIEAVWTVGSLSAHTAAACRGRARHFETVEGLISALAQAPACGSVLVKGSRFMRMERVVAALQGKDQETPHAA
jgi:UDP-N-acetylmuramyl pentapeptide synthase